MKQLEVRGPSKTNKSREEEHSHDCKGPVWSPGYIPAKDQAPRQFSEAIVSSNWGSAAVIRVMWSKPCHFSHPTFKHFSKSRIGEILPDLKIGPNLLSSCLDWLSMSMPFLSLSFTCAKLLVLLLHPIPSLAPMTNHQCCLPTKNIKQHT